MFLDGPFCGAESRGGVGPLASQAAGAVELEARTLAGDRQACLVELREKPAAVLMTWFYCFVMM